MPPKRRGVQKKVVKQNTSVPQQSLPIQLISQQQTTQQTPVDWSHFVELADAANIILHNKPAADGLTLLALYNKLQINKEWKKYHLT
jgi:hypothetical protein